MVDLTPRNLPPNPSPDEAGEIEGQNAATAAAIAVVRRRRLMVALVVAVLVVAAGFVAIQGLQNATLFFRNADEAIELREELGERRFRLQGRVVPSTVASEGGVTTFEVIHNCEVVSVRHTTDPPELFSSPWIPVVLEGAWTSGEVTNISGGDSHYFLSDRMLVKHTNEYVSANETRLSAEAPVDLLTDCPPELAAAAS